VIFDVISMTVSVISAVIAVWAASSANLNRYFASEARDRTQEWHNEIKGLVTVNRRDRNGGERP
jgi:hypothetical protein